MKKRLLSLFVTFFKIGLFTFGGGYAMIALIENECVTKKNWITHEEMMDITVVAESTPGPVAINTATFVGYKFAGTFGSLCATLGVVLPSFIILLAISTFLESFLEIAWVAHAFRGIQVAVAYLITSVGLKMLRKMEKTPVALTVFAAAFAGLLAVDFFAWRFSTIYMILAAAVLGLVLYGVGLAGKGKKS